MLWPESAGQWTADSFERSVLSFHLVVPRDQIQVW